MKIIKIRNILRRTGRWWSILWKKPNKAHKYLSLKGSLVLSFWALLTGKGVHVPIMKHSDIKGKDVGHEEKGLKDKETKRQKMKNEK
jgi:hypothetical protein